MMTTTKQSPNYPRRVSFGTLIVVHETLHVFDFTDAERQDYWFTAVERVQMRCEAKWIARMMISKRHLRPDDQICTRGLELHGPEQAQLRHQVRRKAQQAVFTEQHLQRTQGFTNDVRIAAAYKELASTSQLQAQKHGYIDQMECEALNPFMIQEENRVSSTLTTSPQFPSSKSRLRRLSLRPFSRSLGTD